MSAQETYRMLRKFKKNQTASIQALMRRINGLTDRLKRESEQLELEQNEVAVTQALLEATLLETKRRKKNIQEEDE